MEKTLHKYTYLCPYPICKHEFTVTKGDYNLDLPDKTGVCITCPKCGNMIPYRRIMKVKRVNLLKR